MAMCVPTAQKRPFKTMNYKGKDHERINRSNKSRISKVESSARRNRQLGISKTRNNLTIAQLKELKNAGLVTGEILFDFGSHKARFIFKLTGIAA
jgi:hypothetical protein